MPSNNYTQARVIFNYKGYPGMYLTRNDGFSRNWTIFEPWFRTPPNDRVPDFNQYNCPAVAKKTTVECTECDNRADCPLFQVVGRLLNRVQSIEVNGRDY